MGKAMVVYSYTAKIHFFNELGFVGLGQLGIRDFSGVLYVEVLGHDIFIFLIL